jgi:hypothetical protein
MFIFVELAKYFVYLWIQFYFAIQRFVSQKKHRILDRVFIRLISYRCSQFIGYKYLYPPIFCL